MEDSDLILGLFYSDENNIVYDKIRLDEGLTTEKQEELKMLSFKFLGPLYLTAASGENEDWKIDYIESNLSVYQEKSFQADILQSFFSINSAIESEDGMTYLFTLVGSPYTEDIHNLEHKLTEYIHPCIIQGKIAKEGNMGGDFKFKDFISEELNRGFNLIEFSLGKSRKIYWEEQKKYLCVGVIERISDNFREESNLYTTDIKGSLFQKIKKFIPSYYALAILPDYYEKLIQDTLISFNKKTIFPNIKKIDLSNADTKIKYIEEFSIEGKKKRSFGAILVSIPSKEEFPEAHSISHHKKNLRKILDQKKSVVELLPKLNQALVNKPWNTSDGEKLEMLRDILDKK